jgi:hypothetical protein
MIAVPPFFDTLPGSGEQKMKDPKKSEVKIRSARSSVAMVQFAADREGFRQIVKPRSHVSSHKQSAARRRLEEEGLIPPRAVELAQVKVDATLKRRVVAQDQEIAVLWAVIADLQGRVAVLENSSTIDIDEDDEAFDWAMRQVVKPVPARKPSKPKLTKEDLVAATQRAEVRLVESLERMEARPRGRK